MNISYIILAHKPPLQLARLVEVLDDEGANFVIHLDKRVEIHDFVEALTGSGGTSEKIHLPERVKSGWEASEWLKPQSMA